MLSANVKKSSGNLAYDAAVERAIAAAQPLPVPADPDLFRESFRELTLIFRPRNSKILAETLAQNAASLSVSDQSAIQRTYDNAFSNYRLSDYPSAIRGFESFLWSYPKHALAPNAQYWIGESYFHMRDYRAAIEAQRRLLGTYPDSAKVADSLLIIGTAESNLGDNAAARKTFEELIAKYPASESADKAKGRLAKLK